MRLTIGSTQGDILVLAEAFEIDGSSEKFAVHRAVGMDADLWDEWVATHVETGFKFACGGTIEEAIEAGRAAWTSKTPAQRAEAIARAVVVRRAMQQKHGEGLQ